ncbi:MAG: NADP-dependent oxidoreductase [Thermoplasmata archaeon]
MRAIAVAKAGDPPTLMNLPKPTPGDGEILVHLGAASINPFDLSLASGAFGSQIPRVYPLIMGVDGAGTVEAVGPGVKRFSLNDAVYGQFFHPPVGIGTYAEYVVAPETLGIALRPRGMYNDQAAAVPTAGMTALDTVDKLALTEHQSLLILGAAGGVGSFVVQFASRRRLATLAASRGPNREFLTKLGASRFYDSSAMSFIDDVRRGYPTGVDALLDLHNRGADFEKNLPLVRSGGMVASTVGSATEAVLGPRGLKGLNVNLQPRAELLDRLSEEFSAGRLRIPVEEKLRLDEVPDALLRKQQGIGRGKTVIKI